MLGISTLPNNILQNEVFPDWVPSKFSANHFFDITSLRSLIHIAGPDSAKFINGLCTSLLTSSTNAKQEEADANNSSSTDGFYTSFLTPQPLESSESENGVPELLLDVSSEMKEQALSHLARYKLLSKVKIQDVSEQFSIVNLAGSEIFTQLNGPTENKSLTAAQAKKFGASYASWDHRFRSEELGIRLIIPTNNAVPKETYFNAAELSCSDYILKMTCLGIGETPRGIVSLVSLPMECNLELLNGIHFRKGCYVGQELTIRTHHKGVIRKRLMPAKLITNEKCATQLSGADLYLPAENPEVKRKPIGKVTWVFGQHILALMRLESLPKPGSKQLVCEFEFDGTIHQITLEFSYPPWIRPMIS
ncbi:ccr4 associated factor [Entomophthora muscae]|uniref:Ccr4 associated factor n=1 Tax=Entomophthora muscae TaxID=34485 RepID=A0ACC2U4W9_9FUNG|nr:ccr4 associated factor [Entomophthora muscae]